MPRRSTKQRKPHKQRGGGYNRPSEYFGVSSGQYLDANDTALSPRAANPAVARAGIPVRGHGTTDVTHIQSGGGYNRPSEYFGVPSGQYLDANDPALAHHTSNHPLVARAVIPVRGIIGATEATHMTGGGRKRRSCRRNRKARKVLSRRRHTNSHQVGGAPSDPLGGGTGGANAAAMWNGGSLSLFGGSKPDGGDSKAYTAQPTARTSTETNLARDALDVSGEVTGLQTGGRPTETTYRRVKMKRL